MSDLISREEAKEALRERFKRIPTYAIWAMHIIDELPTHQTPSNTLGALDCVERQKAIDAIYKEWDGSSYDGDGYHIASECERVLDDLPSIWPQPRKGKWIYGEHDVAMCDGYRCDKCGFFVPWDYQHKFIDFIKDYIYCPSCGADMEVKND